MLRFFTFLLGAYLLTLFHSAVMNEVLPHSLKPDLMLIMVVYLGISPLLISGAILASLCGLFYDTFSGSPLGLFPFIYLGIFFGIKILGKFLILGETIGIRIILVGLALSFQTLMVIFLPLALGIYKNLPFPPWNWILAQAAITCLACWPMFYLFKKLELIAKTESPQATV